MTEADVLRYDAIPDELFEGHMLEVGARRGEVQLLSRHRERFLASAAEGRYVGIDVLDSLGSELPVLRVDVFDLPDIQYNAVLMLEVAEHICIRDWPRLFAKLRDCTAIGGHLFMTVPYRESIKEFEGYLGLFDKEPFGGHVVYGITPDPIRLFLPDAKFRVLRKRHPFKTEDENWLWAFGRFVKRALLREYLAFNWLRWALSCLVVEWTNGG